MNLVKDQISLFTPLQASIEWNKFGYKDFNPKDRAFFASVFKQNHNIFQSLTLFFPLP